MCHLEKLLSEFSIRRASPDGLRHVCRECAADYDREYRKIHKEQAREHTRRWGKANPEWLKQRTKNRHKMNPNTRRNARLKRVYGISGAQYEAMLVAQNGVCAICGGTFEVGPFRKPCVDHDHITGAVRGLLCNDCNVGLGFYERKNFATSAAAYLSAPQLTLVANDG